MKSSKYLLKAAVFCTIITTGSLYAAEASASRRAEGDSGDREVVIEDSHNPAVQTHSQLKESTRFLEGVAMIEAGKLKEAEKYIPQAWVEKYASLIQNSKPGPLLPGKWGFSRAQNNKVLLFIRNWPAGHSIQLPNTEHAIHQKSAKSLSGGTIRLSWAIALEIFMNPAERDPVATVIEYNVSGDAEKAHKVHVPDWTDPSLNASPEAVKQWQEMRFGLFIHLSPCVINGQGISWTRKGSRMGRLRQGGAGVDGTYKGDPEYDQLYKQFNPQNYDANEWVLMAKNAGMKYLVMTTKHHDGFSLFDSKVSDYDIMATPYGKDMIAQLADACHKHGIKLGLYYSPRDWYHKDYGRESTHEKYIEFYLEQLRELATNYGKVDIIWFDAFDSPQYLWGDTAEKSVRMMYELQPNIVLNDRSGLRGDYDTPEQRIGIFERNRPWETCTTIGSGWAWNKNTAKTTKSLRSLVHYLLNTAGRDGNLLLGLGPRADGTFEPVQAARLMEVGEWLKKYGHTIYGTRGGPILPSKGFVSTCKENKIYLHLMNSQQSILLPDLGCNVLSAKCLIGGKVNLEMQGDKYNVTLEGAPEDPIDLIIELELDANAETIMPMELSNP